MSAEKDSGDSQPLSTTYASDRPWRPGDRDPLRRIGYAKRIAETLAHSGSAAEGIVVGLYGPWGEGKTSLLHMVEMHLQDRGVEALWFNPWYFKGQDALIRAFFDELARKLSARLGTKAEEFKRVLNKYGTILSALPVSLGGVDPGRLMTGVASQIGDSSLEDLKHQLETLLAERDVSIVVFMDDIDRLDRSEIHSVLKLVKLVAGFPGIRYVLAFDDEMVAAAVGEAYGGGDVAAGRSFLEKIVQVPLRLPRIDSATARYLALTEVDRALRGAAIDVIENDALEFHLHFLPLFDASPRTLRVGKRYGNALSFALPLLRGEARTVDLLLIEALRVFTPQVHAALPEHRDLLLGEHNFSWGSAAKEHREREKQQWEDLIALAEPSDRRPVADLLEHLFPRVLRFTRNTSYGPEWNTNWAREQRITSSLYFDRYFQYAVPPNDLSDETLRRLLAQLDRPALDEAIKTFDGAVDEANAARAIEKLRIREDTLSASQAASLVKLILDRGPPLPNERTFLGSPPRQQSVVLIYKAMLRVPVDERKSLAIAAVSEPTPLAFSVDCLYWFEHSKERDDRQIARLFSEDDEGALRELLATRVRERMQSEPLYLAGEPGTTAKLLYFWTDTVSKEDRAAVFRARFDQDPFEASELLDALAMRAITSQNRRLPPTIEREQYDSISKVIDPEFLIGYLRRAYGEQAEPTERDSLARDVEDEEDEAGELAIDEKLRLARRFILLHEMVVKSRVAAAGPEPAASEELPE